MHQRRADQVLTQEPGLQFVAAKHVAHDHVVSSLIAQLVCSLGQLTAMTNNDLVRIQQPRDDHWNFFSATRRTFDPGSLGDIMGHRDGKPAEQLNALGNRVHHFDLLVEMFIEQKMKLIKRRPYNLPMRLLVQIAQGHSVCEELIELFGHFQTNWLFEFKMKGMSYGAIGLNLAPALMHPRLGGL